ncbi:MAG: polyphenol oxidase family protein [Bdellovibrionota bacterium]
MSFIETDLGFIKEQDQHLIFFGKNSATLDQIKQAYPKLTFRHVHQKHTDICLPSISDSIDMIADAHFTTDRKIALVVKTADCQPILAYNKSKSLILAIHAGWRGVENQITSKSLLQCGLQQADIFIGPCIQQSSFEVDLDVKEQLEKICKISADSEDFRNTFNRKNIKFYIDLTRIVIADIKAAGIDASISLLPFDTVTDLKFHSYRRDKHNSGRNLSFIAQL